MAQQPPRSPAAILGARGGKVRSEAKTASAQARCAKARAAKQLYRQHPTLRPIPTEPEVEK